MKPLPKLSRSGTAALACTSAFAVFYGVACWMQYRAFGYDDFDLAIHTQSVWNLLHGSLDCSILGMPWPGNHANWIIVPLALVFALAPSPFTLLTLQTLALALATWPIFLLAKREFGGDRFGFFFVAAYCLYAPVGHVALYEFHPVAFATPLLLAAFYCARIGNNRWFVVWSVLAASCQEDVPLLVAALCVYRIFAQRERRACAAEAVSSPRRRVSLVLGGAMLAWFFLCVAVIGPHFNRGNIGWLNLYEQFGKSGGEILVNFILRPDIVLETLWQPDRGEFLLRMLGPFLLLSLLAPRALLIALPSFLQHMLSTRGRERSLEYHYAATIVPFVVAAAILGLARLCRWLETSRARAIASDLRQTILIAMILTLLATNLVYGGFYRRVAHRDQFRRTALAVAKERLLTQIPPDAAVICSFDTMARLAMRSRCYSMHYVVSGKTTLGGYSVAPPPPPTVDYAVLDFSDPITFERFYHPALPQPSGAVIPSSEQLTREFFRRGIWTSEEWVNSFALFRRAKPNTQRWIAARAIEPPGKGAKMADGTVAYLSMEWLEETSKSNWFMLGFLSPTGATPTKYLFWLRLDLVSTTTQRTFSIRRGPCQLFDEADYFWRPLYDSIPSGEYEASIVLYDREAFAAAAAKDPRAVASFQPAAKIPVGKIVVGRSVAF